MLKKLKRLIFGEYQSEEVTHIDLPDNIEYSQSFINWYKKLKRL
jgi:hypothetical protein